jgi:hypothetical protein
MSCWGCPASFSKTRPGTVSTAHGPPEALVARTDPPRVPVAESTTPNVTSRSRPVQSGAAGSSGQVSASVNGSRVWGAYEAGSAPDTQPVVSAYAASVTV